MESWTYSKAGVDIEKEAAAVKSIADILKTTFKNRPGAVLSDIGAFANLIDIGNNKALAMCTDGVGTKVLVAKELGKYDTVGIDMVAMNVNDLITLGAEPLALVDYLAVQEATPEMLGEIGKGIKEGADQSGIAVIGGETATIPELVNGFDLAGTCVGLVDKDKVITGKNMQEGDVLIGLKSSGIHSNGLTLARKVLDMKDKKVLEALLTPTKIYVKPILELLKQVNVNGMAHMTGGGLLNLKRLNSGIGFEITDWPEPHMVFKDIQDKGNVSDEEMYKTFNMGIGFCIVVSKTDAEKALEVLKSENPLVLGQAVPGNTVKFNELEF